MKNRTKDDQTKKSSQNCLKIEDTVDENVIDYCLCILIRGKDVPAQKELFDRVYRTMQSASRYVGVLYDISRLKGVSITVPVELLVDAAHYYEPELGLTFREVIFDFTTSFILDASPHYGFPDTKDEENARHGFFHDKTWWDDAGLRTLHGHTFLTG